MATALRARENQGVSHASEDAAAELAASLGGQPPFIPSKYLYDDIGSGLFEEITGLPEYYQTRTEWAILNAHAGEIIDRARPRELVELGAGNGRKIGVLLQAMREHGRDGRCTLLDINQLYVEAAAAGLRSRFPEMSVRGVHGDFLSDLTAVGPTSDAERRMFVFFAGTFGNLLPYERARFLRQVAAALAPGGTLLVGLDLVKDPAVLEAAYNDAAGVTAAFNLNILRVVNRLADGNFDPSDFVHRAFYDPLREWVEMRVLAARECRVRLDACDLDLELAAGDEIRTEVSAKFTRASLERTLDGTGLALTGWFSDPAELFALALVRRVPD